MKKKSQRIDKVRAVAEAEEKACCREMGASQRKLDEEIERLEELKAYRVGYDKKQATPATIGAVQWADYQRFLQRLDEAVAAQSLVVLDNREKVELHRRQWMVKRQRLESLGRVVERFRNLELVEEERRLQKSMDELSSATGGFRIK